ncbi:MAG: RNA-directed DNA polymerase [bacterium]|uniref:RNA-directed DNA polymerase n=1 Tax=Candidatus Aphodosoma intestinipullorum TaxID=2840674 RepID=A0A940DIL4_9BACT|nr:RNA-directed DNA polymerase [Candidatus Aphodosoma intestinipullorum]
METNGLLIGPHASNLLSEIVLTAVDSKLSKKYKYIRNIGDYTCYVQTSDDAEKFLTDLAKELRKYDLTLNIKKTRIVELPTAAGEDWINQLNSFPAFCGRAKEKEIELTRKEVKAFLDLALNLAQRKDDFAVITYAVKMLSSKSDDDDEKRKVKLDTSALRWYLSRMHHLLLAYPYLVHVVDGCVLKMEGVEVEDIKKMGDDLYRVGKEKRLWEACSYALYWSIEYGYEPEAGGDNIAEEAVRSEDCIFMLLAYLRARKDGDDAAKDKMVIKAKELRDKDFERYWLFVYEVYRFEGEVLWHERDNANGKSKDKPKKISRLDKILGQFECLREAGISFIVDDFSEKCNR